MTDASTPLLTIRDLRVTFGSRPAHEVVHGIDLDVAGGEVVALVGESGSGKSVSAMSILRLLPEGAGVTGSIRLDGKDVLAMSQRELRSMRGNTAALISQDPIASLNPVFTIGFQVVEAVRAHSSRLSAKEARRRAIELLTLVEIPEPELRMKQYPHELSGGQCQRVGIAMALAADPQLLIADEPTTALDVTIQAEILDVLSRLGREQGRGVLLITHDMGVVADIADRVLVMHQGALVEHGTTQSIFDSPQRDYTRALLDAVPRIGRRGPSPAPVSADRALEISGLVVEYGGRLKRTVRAVDGVDVHVRPGEMRGLVGESGSGKSTIGRAVIGAAPITAGHVAVNGREVTSATPRQRRHARQAIGVVFQNPSTSLNPRYTVAQTVAEPLTQVEGLRGAAVKARVQELLEAVRLDGHADHYGHELSGGQKQRVAIARAVALRPTLLIADEPTSALDVSVQAQVLDVFRDVQREMGFGCLFISHDLAVIDELCDTVTVLHRGRVIEEGHREQVLTHPSAEYTRRLLAAAPVPDPSVQAQRRAQRLAGAA
ncbi:ABC transporter ATP-binding protein [Demequina sp. NBRC 110051]|uniref:dipeptide ABC transporter ATP-binding protein n=1 Tax=Demequina sp. NBRC 110051 TaxID=1570340 RepID=UPI0009FE3B31|nr:ABC transporter ATP-binding protein [Demequina sp. NBRC 110051]